jgi:hypothetical protein
MRIARSISRLDGDALSDSCLGCFTLGDRAPGTHWRGDLLDARVCLDVVEKRELVTTLNVKVPKSYKVPGGLFRRESDRNFFQLQGGQQEETQGGALYRGQFNWILLNCG